MANKHIVCITDAMSGTDVRTDIQCGKYFYNDLTFMDIDNGRFLKIDKLINRNMYKLVPAEDTTPIDQLALVASPEFLPDPRYQCLDDFYNPAGEAIRFYRLKPHDKFSLSKLGFLTAPKVGDKVFLSKGSPSSLSTATTTSSDTTAIGEIIDAFILGGIQFYTVEVGK